VGEFEQQGIIVRGHQNGRPGLANFFQ
jgi:hypothetical protein